MKIVMTMLVRDEADILDAQIAFHLNAGVDFVIATDHRSQDGTTDILARYAREGHAHVLREESDGFRQAEWVTRMARLAATDFGATWVINADADEFWWPREGPLKEILASVPCRYGVVRCFERHFAPKVDESGHFAERMTVRVTPHGPHTGPEDPFQTAMQVIHRADPSVSVAQGNHDVTSGGLLTLRGWYPFEVLHFPLRTLEQARRKFDSKQRAIRAEPAQVGLHMLSAGRAIEEGRFEDWYSTYLVDESALAGGLTAGAFVLDTRLRDALRTLAAVPSLSTSALEYARPRADGPLLEFSKGGLSEDARYADEMEPLDEWDGQRRFLGRVDALDERIAELERRMGSRVRRRARRLRTTLWAR
jgi:hypothetical protein